MGILDSMAGGGGKLGALGGASASPDPNWAKSLLDKRANYTPPPAPNYSGAGGPFGGLMGILGGAWNGAGVDMESGPMAAIMQILGGLNGKLGGTNPSAPAAAPAAAPNPRPAPVQFDPQAYLQSRLGGNSASYPSNIKLPF
jgi:hypothetical protein